MKKFFGVVLVLLFAWIGCNNDNGTQNTTPTITGMTPNQVNNGQSNVAGAVLGQNLNGVTKVDLGPGITISDFHSVSPSQVSVTFSVDGNATAGPRTISVTTAAGIASSSTALSVVVNNKAPVARISVTPGSGGDTNTVYHLSGAKSSDSDGRVVEWVWTFQDLTHVVRGKEVDHKFSKAGTFNVGLTVADNKGLKSDDQAKVSVAKVTSIVCTRKLAYKRVGVFGTVLAVDGSTYTFRTDSNQTCATAFYKCGDFSNPSESEYYGFLCTMTDLGHNTFLIGVKGAHLKPPVGQRAFIKAQNCRFDPCR